MIRYEGVFFSASVLPAECRPSCGAEYESKIVKMSRAKCVLPASVVVYCRGGRDEVNRTSGSFAFYGHKSALSSTMREPQRFG